MTPAVYQQVTPTIPDWNGVSPKERKLWFGVATEGMEAPWMSAYGACFVKIWDVRRSDSGTIEYGVGNEDKPLPKGVCWVTAKDFYHEWPD